MGDLSGRPIAKENRNNKDIEQAQIQNKAPAAVAAASQSEDFAPYHAPEV